MSSHAPLVVIGLGSSAEGALDWLRRAMRALKLEPGLVLRSVSRIHESDAMMPEGAPPSWNVPYLNLAAAFETSRALHADPPRLLAMLKGIESRLGRVRRERWAPREIDLDILAWDGVALDVPELTIPHRGLLGRPFALLPLAEAHPGALPAIAGAAELARRWAAVDPDAVPFRTRLSRRRLTETVTILNVTPDSFSDGGRLGDARALVDAAERAASGGSSILDLGAESTRPGATPVTPDEEWRRLEPALRALQPLRARGARLSLDTRHAPTARRALELESVDWINDVGGLADPAMREAVRDSRAELVFMHSLSVPPRQGETLPPDADPVASVLQWARARVERLESEGIERSRLILDPGLGFGKSDAQNLRLIERAGALHELGLPVFFGHSRKAFLTRPSPGPLEPGQRDLETALASAHLAACSVEYLRIHDIASQARALAFSAAWARFL